MSFDKQVSEICKASYFHIHALRHIKSPLILQMQKQLTWQLFVPLNLFYFAVISVNKIFLRTTASFQ